MYLNYRNFPKITFPVYRLPSDNWYSKDGILFVDNIVVDDKNQPGDTLGVRRLQTHFNDTLPLPKAAETLVSMIKNPSGPYIDTAGKCFIYKKTKYCKLKYYRIRTVDKKTEASVLWLWSVKFPFTIPRPPPIDAVWAGVLHLGDLPWLLYNYAKIKPKDTRRKI